MMLQRGQHARATLTGSFPDTGDEAARSGATPPAPALHFCRSDARATSG